KTALGRGGSAASARGAVILTLPLQPRTAAVAPRLAIHAHEGLDAETRNGPGRPPAIALLRPWSRTARMVPTWGDADAELHTFKFSYFRPPLMMASARPNGSWMASRQRWFRSASALSGSPPVSARHSRKSCSALWRCLLKGE